MSDFKPVPYSPNRYSQPGSNQPKRRNHPFILSGIFDILVKLEADSINQYGTRTYQTAISTLSEESSDIVEWVINAIGYVGPETQLEAANSYYLKGRLLAFNTQATQNFYFESDHHVLVNTSDARPCGLANTISVTGVGLIVSRSVETISPGKDNVTIVVKHSDYNPATRTQESFEVRYRCNWSKLMEKLQVLLVPAREVVITGHVTGWIPSIHTWIVDITGVNIMSGPENNYASSGSMPIPSLMTPGGRSCGKIAFTGTPSGVLESPSVELDASPAVSPPASASKNKRRVTSKSKSAQSDQVDTSPVTSSPKRTSSAVLKSPTPRSPAKRSKVVHPKPASSAEEDEAAKMTQ
ncbi:hypothetical protein DFH28DRAFT_897146 [Melampsora americana]|nr:hypothetical protein DFH28DRAFT_897146 [Melampsora americana]